jgi:hypothetical protein
MKDICSPHDNQETKSKKQEGAGAIIPFKNMLPVTYFFRLGSTS